MSAARAFVDRLKGRLVGERFVLAAVPGFEALRRAGVEPLTAG